MRGWRGEGLDEEALKMFYQKSILHYCVTLLGSRLININSLSQSPPFSEVWAASWLPWQHVSNSRCQRRERQHRITPPTKSSSLQTHWNSSHGVHMNVFLLVFQLQLHWAAQRTTEEFPSKPSVGACHAKGLGIYTCGKLISGVCVVINHNLSQSLLLTVLTVKQVRTCW